ncbi:RCC1 domain-containing protein [Hymenobacter properus]|uniref:IPT/TIG domain-containing protein n=1 Tax=Hymenobacter properus TaxID=2791026 RepID=A0A931FKD8_9BACT|nr:FG-GAP-like repeat-containing protein [Hymenobacter properus]MBF9141600.1 IPT/TIG domain-containing protein [Hymenobacter properus]MBR7720409.1 IPT/TIG domain-containing protein [Microvirga sp. SRT04]
MKYVSSLFLPKGASRCAAPSLPLRLRWAVVLLLLVAPLLSRAQDYWMTPAAITTCSGNLYDPAGPVNNTTSSNTTYSTTLTPATPGTSVRLIFTQYYGQASEGSLFIYDGPDTNAPLIGEYSQNPRTVTANNVTGQLTVVLKTLVHPIGSSGVGFSAIISCQRSPYISSFTPTSGTGGTSVVLTGRNFTGATDVTFNSMLGYDIAATSFTVNSDNQITVQVPAGAPTGPISVQNGSGTGTSAANYTSTDSYWMTPAAITACSGTLYDPAGPIYNTTNYDYAYPKTYTTTLTPATPGASMRLNFTSFYVPYDEGRLLLYDGPDTNAPLIGEYSRNTPPGTVTASNATGQLTVVFRNILTLSGSNGTGFAATISCVNRPYISSFTPTSGTGGTSVVLTGRNFTGTTAVTFNNTLGNGLAATSFTVDNDNQITVQVPAGAPTGPISVTNAYDKGTSAAHFITGTYWMGPAAITTCSGTLYNPGGPSAGNPAGSATTTLTPATPGAKVRLSFSQFSVNESVVLSIYDGPDTNAPLIGQYYQNDVPGTVTATNATGQLTVRLIGNLTWRQGVANYTAAVSCATGMPTVSSFTPSSGGQGDLVVITGTGFTNATGVAFNGSVYNNRVPAPGFVINSSTQITVPVPAGATVGRISVSNANGAGSSSTDFTPLPPVISSFTPTSGTGGTSVVLTGNYFTGTTAVAFNGLAAPNFVVNSSTQITVPVPAGVTTGPITVTTSFGTGTSSVFATDVILIGTAAVTTCSGSIYDSGGPNGNYGNDENLTTTITPATAGAKVRLSFSQINTRSGTDVLRVYDGPNTSAPFLRSFGAGSAGGVVTATNPTGQLTLNFTSGNTNYYMSGFAAAISCVKPTISSFTPTSGQAGTTVVITGTEFNTTTAVRFNGVLAPGFVVNSDTQITVNVPAGATSGPISVIASYGTAVSAGSFTVPQPALTAVSPFLGVPGTVLTLTGTNLSGTSAITFTGSAGVKTVTSGFVVNAAGTQITGVVVPAGAQSGPVTATTGGGTAPVATALFSRATTLAAGGSHMVAVRADGSLWAWGNNANGQLGLGSAANQNTPQRVGTGNSWVSVAAGGSYTLAIQADGSLWAWGLNDSGQLGLGNTTNQNTPQRVGTSTSWASVTAGTYHTAAVQADGSLWTWGYSGSGQLGLGSTLQANSPTRVGTGTTWASAAAGEKYMLAVQADGSLWAWGGNEYGQLGLGNTTNQNTPQRVGTSTNWVSAKAGKLHSAAVQADGSLWAWGLNTNGQLGLGNTTNQNTPQRVGTSTNWLSAAAGDAHSLAVQADGTLWAWGANANGQLGLGNTTNQTTPQSVAAVTSWLSAAAGTGYSAGEQSCGATWAWGLNTAGQVGDGSTTARTSPVLIYNPISLLTFSPATAGSGSPVTVTGTNLAGLTALTVNGANAFTSVTNSTATGFTFVVPAAAPLGAGTVTVAAGCGTGSSTAFTVGAPTPILNTVSPAAELPGQAVTLTGLNFTSTSTVSFGGVAAASVTYNSATSLTAVVPVGATPGSSAVVVSTATGSSPNSPAFEVLQVYRGTAASGCLATASVSITGSGGANTWRYLRLPGAGGAVVAAIEDTRNLGTVSAGMLDLGTATTAPVRTDANVQAYFDRNFYLTATNKTFTGQTVRVRFFGLSSELTRLAAVDANATLAGLKASQYSGANENCDLVDNDPNGESRLLPAPATMLSGADWFTAQVSVTNHFSEFYLTAASVPLQAVSQAPMLTGVSPARNLPTAPRGANVALTFSQPIATGTAGNVRVFGSQSGGQLVRGGNATASGNLITVDPTRPFAPGERVMVTVPATVQSTAGYNALAQVHEFTAGTVPATGTFLTPPTQLNMGGAATSVAVGDLNGDGMLDVVTSDPYSKGFYSAFPSPGVVVRLGAGGGQFDAAGSNPLSDPGNITLGDVDGDGDLDIVITPTTYNGSITVRLNNSQGQFPPGGRNIYLYSYTGPSHVVLGDVDGDGDLDMLIAASKASVSFNDGTGNFTSASTTASSIPTANAASDVALADVDGDGDLDALIANNNQVSVRLNNGSGSFSGGTDVPVGGALNKLAVGDVNGDGYLDFATSSGSAASLSVRLNNGNGTFGGGTDYPVSFTPGSLALGDVDGDGYLDLAAAGYSSSSNSPGQAAVRLNNGNGTFSGGSDFATGGSRASVALGDMDNDGTLDLVTPHLGYQSGYDFNSQVPIFSMADLFIRFNTALPPTITGFSPQSGLAGTPVTITGTNLNRVRGVRFGGSSELALLDPNAVQTATSLTVLVPVRAASGVITLTSAQGVNVPTATSFTYTPRPLDLVATLSPAGPLDVCQPRTLTATAASPAFAAGGGINLAVFAALEQPNGKLLLGGAFTTYQGATANHLIRLNPDGSPESTSTFSTGTGATAGFNGTVYSAALQADGKLLVGGIFTTYQGAPANQLIRLNPDGSPDATFNTGAGAGFTGGTVGVNSIAVQPDGKILLGGDFTTYQGATANRLIRLNPDGSPDILFGTGTGATVGLNGVVNSIVVQPDGKILLGGDFTMYKDATASYLIRLNADGSPDASFAVGNSFQNTVYGLALQADGKVLVHGSTFSQSLRYLVRLTANGSTDGTFNAGALSGTVNHLALQADGKIVVVGTFTRPGSRIARLTTTGSVDGTFNAGGSGLDNGARRVLVQSDGNILVTGGSFLNYNGAAAPKLIRLNADGIPNMPTPVSGATFTFSPGGTTTNPLVTNTAGSYSVVASLNGATSAPSNTVTLTPCTTMPTITVLSTAAELPGMPVTITGTGFAAGSTVSFGGVAASSVTVNSATSLTAVVPAGAVPGSSAVVVGTPGLGNSASAPPFTVLAVYSGTTLGTCLPAVPATASVGDGAWHYLLSSGGQVVAAYNYTGTSLGNLSIDVLLADPAQPVRHDAGSRSYLDRNWHLTASAGRFDGRTVQLRLYGLNSEQARLLAADNTATLANLKATQYSGPNEDCQLGNNDATGERRVLPAPASSPAGTAWFAAEMTVADHFSEFYLTGSSTPLPVELLSFTAEKRGTTVALAWATASEKNSDRFEVERSRDGRIFERIGQVAAAGSSVSIHRYDFLDRQYPGETNQLYYRLRQVDLDGTFSYSPMRTVTVGGPATLALFPNPTHGGAATLTGAVPGTTVRVYDALGREVLAAMADASGTAALALPVGLPAGVYVVHAGSKALRLTVE